MPYKTYLNWSTGKDAALALYYLMQAKNYEVAHLLTSVNTHHNRVSMHGLRKELLKQQADSINLPYSTVELPEQPDMNTYEAAMNEKVLQLKMQGFTHAAFGDIFLEDLRTYREQQLNALGMTAHFPLWKRDTKKMLLELIELGFKSIVICTNAALLPESFCGRMIDTDFLNDLPLGIDPCGENGEFHTFCYDGPIFKKPVEFIIGERVYREYKAPTSLDNNDCFTELRQQKMGFWFCDLLPVADSYV